MEIMKRSDTYERRLISLEYQLLTPRIPVQQNLTPVEQVFANRGIQPSEINHYLHTTKEDVLNPELLENIKEGAKLFISHLFKGSRIFVQVDSDADGYTSAAALINYANMIAPGHAQRNITYAIHNGKEHGLILEKIPKDVKLVIAPDSSSNQYEEHKILKEQGVDVLVLDHHEADKFSENACVINNQIGNYPNKTLSGVGIVYKFCQYIDSLLDETERGADLILDLVAIGMVADLMDLRDFETRALISYGVNHLENPFLIEFVKSQAYSLKGEVTPFGISFYIAPYINAVVRVGTLDEKMLLFESMLDFRAYEEIPSTKRGCKGQTETRVEQACRTCKNIKNRSNRMRDASLDMIESQIEEKQLLNYPIIIIELIEPVEENMTGLIANQIMGKYMRPVLILNRHIEVDEGTGEVLLDIWRGSGRNATYSKLDNMREFLEKSGLVEYAQGHAGAFGIGVLNEKLDELKKYINTTLKDLDFSNSYRVDFIWNANSIEEYKNDIMDLGKLSRFWGQGLPEPQIAIENIKVHKDNIVLMSPDKKPTLKIILPGNLTLIKFGSSKEEFDNLYKETGCITINAIGTCNLNEWNGNFSPQIIIEEYEIINKTDFYF